jgi:Asp-tRNA(Asn)/Glu-tRNA(Gln) amidotransferase A subunit family amidase
MTSLRDGELETAAEMAEAIRTRQVSPVDLIERALARAEAWQPSTNAFSQLWADHALGDAGLVEVAARALARSPHPAGGVGATRGFEQLPLSAGIPIAVKDLFDVAGRETTGCCAAYEGNLAKHDAPTVAAVRDTGMVMLGKTNQHELAAGGTNLVSAIGRTGNPWDPRRMTGGSSGGSAAVVASGVVPWALGSDTGGSIRIPASMCGVFGLKPTTGRLSTRGLLPLAPSLDCPGPMASTAVDLWLLFCVLADAPATELTSDGPFRIAVPGGFFQENVHPETRAAVEAVAGALSGAGAEVREVDDEPRIDAVGGIRWVWARICYPEFARAHPGIDRSRVAPSVVEWMEMGESFPAEDLAQASVAREEIGRWFRSRLEGLDALVIPTTPYPAPLADQGTVDLGPAGTVRVDRVGPGWLTSALNLAGLPAVSLPAGRSSEGLPIGVSLAGPDGSEERLLQLAALWERAAGHVVERPSLPPDGS